jgi:hypothetical protein
MPNAVPDATALVHITSVHLLLESENDARRAASVLNSIPGIVNLAIYVESLLASREGALVSELCNSMQRFSRLKSLLLRARFSGSCGSKLLEVCNFERLDKLQLVDCGTMGHLHKPLGPLQLVLQTLRVEPAQSKDVNDFLLSTTVTQELSIVCLHHVDEVDEDDWVLDWASVIPHAATLRSSRLDLDGRLQDMPGFLRFCESASNLRRLAVSCPEIEEEKWAQQEGFLAWLVSTCAFLPSHIR